MTPWERLQSAMNDPGAGPYKFCAGCRSTLPLSDYTADHSTGDGRQGECKSCRADLRAHERATSTTHQESAARRAAAMADGDLTAAQVRRMKADALGTPCPACARSLDTTAEADHILALSLGGRHVAKNIIILCHGCHVEKTRADRAEAKKRGAHNPYGLGETSPPGA